jgi:pimeloyl-ACP methyl ester carboxylesterase
LRRPNVDSGAIEHAIRAGFRLLNRAMPSLGAALAEELFFTPPRSRPSKRIAGLLEGGQAFELTSGGRRIAAWSWGEGPRVYLVHGWGGRGGQLAEFVSPLLEHGFSVTTFDAPAHGGSAGRRTSLLDFYDVLRTLVDRLGNGHGVIAHSLGASAAALALHRRVPLGRAVFIGPSAEPAEWTRRFAHRFRIAPHVVVAMQARSERRLGVRWEDLKLTALARELASPLLVIHDEDDEDVPWSDGALVASVWPGARLLTTRGLGHRQVLKHPDVLRAATDFLLEGGPPPRAGLRPAGGARAGTAHSDASASAALERYLFQRDGRSEGHVLI